MLLDRMLYWWASCRVHSACELNDPCNARCVWGPRGRPGGLEAIISIAAAGGAYPPHVRGTAYIELVGHMNESVLVVQHKTLSSSLAYKAFSNLSWPILNSLNNIRPK